MLTMTCPICHEPFNGQSSTGPSYRPFCSHRCKTIDLGRWLDGAYRIKSEEEEERTDSEEDDLP